MEFLETVGATLKAVRLEHGLSQTEIAVRTGLPGALISKYEVGETSPRLDSLVKILGALGATLEEFCARAERKGLTASIGLDVEAPEGGTAPKLAVPGQGEAAGAFLMVELPSGLADLDEEDFYRRVAEFHGLARFFQRRFRDEANRQEAAAQGRAAGAKLRRTGRRKRKA